MMAASSMTIISIALQSSMKDHFGRNGCYFFWTASMIYTWGMVTSGFGMAVYRLICFQNLFKKELDTKAIIKKFIVTEWVFGVCMIFTYILGYNLFGWEKAVYYQFCMDLGPKHVKTLHEYHKSDFNLLLYMILRIVPNIIALVMFIMELVIYLWIIYNLWKHDKRSYEDKIITEHMKNERHQKNVITLYGQVATFAVKMFYCIYLTILGSNFFPKDPSLSSISLIICATIISVVQFCASHEMKRFLRNKFNLY